MFWRTSALSILISVTLSVLFQRTDSRCYPDRRQDCDEGAITAPWKTSVRFFLFTRRNPDDPELLHKCRGTLPVDTHFKPDKDLIVFIQGYALGICDLDAIRGIKDELLVRGDYNVLVPECSREYGFFYSSAVGNTPKVAEVIARVLQNIQRQTGIKNSQIYLIGISLGAQTAGVVGHLFPVRRITGLDPVRLSFSEDTPIDSRLDPSDAGLVDVIHCNGGNSFPFVAIDYPAGDADFYVNGGSQQPECFHDAWISFKKLKLWYAFGISVLPSVCSHAQCLEYFRLSINNRYGVFAARSCDTYEDFRADSCGDAGGASPVAMGFEFERYFTETEKSKPFPRKYFLQISSEWPYVSKNSTSN